MMESASLFGAVLYVVCIVLTDLLIDDKVTKDDITDN